MAEGLAGCIAKAANEAMYSALIGGIASSIAGLGVERRAFDAEFEK
jgi:hypothetical protein